MTAELQGALPESWLFRKNATESNWRCRSALSKAVRGSEHLSQWFRRHSSSASKAFSYRISCNNNNKHHQEILTKTTNRYIKVRFMVAIKRGHSSRTLSPPTTTIDGNNTKKEAHEHSRQPRSSELETKQQVKDFQAILAWQQRMVLDIQL